MSSEPNSFDPETFGRRLREEFIRTGCAGRSELEGLNEAELDKVRRAIGRLPLAYEIFLRVAGKNAGWLWRGSDYLYPTLLEIPGWVEESLAEFPTSWRPGSSDVPIWAHGGHTYVFLSGTGDDPQAIRWVEGDEAEKVVRDSFSSLIVHEVQEGGEFRWKYEPNLLARAWHRFRGYTKDRTRPRRR